MDNGNIKEVNYVKFCDEVDNVSEILETVIKGIEKSSNNYKLENDIITDTKDIKLMDNLFIQKKLTSLQGGL